MLETNALHQRALDTFCCDWPSPIIQTCNFSFFEKKKKERKEREEITKVLPNKSTLFFPQAYTLDNCNCLEALLLKGQALLSQKRVDDAITHYREALRLGPGRYEAHKGKNAITKKRMEYKWNIQANVSQWSCQVLDEVIPWAKQMANLPSFQRFCFAILYMYVTEQVWWTATWWWTECGRPWPLPARRTSSWAPMHGLTR